VRFDRRSLDGLGVLGAVVEAGSFVRAGEALGLTQSAVSRAVAHLEACVECRGIAFPIAPLQKGSRTPR
jgi:hypothetical protein